MIYDRPSAYRRPADAILTKTAAIGKREKRKFEFWRRRIFGRICGMDTNAVRIAAWIAAAYFIGGVPFGFLIGKMRGVDVRTVGSGNIGATNVFRTVGRGWGLIALFLDMLKGFVPTFACRLLCAEPSWLPLAVGVSCVVGHMLTPYMRFRGGKGVATGAGMLFALVPALTGITFLLFAVVFAMSNYISLGSCVAATFIGAAIWIPVDWLSRGWHDLPQCVLVTVIAAFIVWKHRSNIARLAAGNENKIYLTGAKGPDGTKPKEA